MRKVIAAMLLAVALVFICGQSNQVEARGLRSYAARVVNIRTYLSLREEPSTYSRELARIPNGTYLEVFENEGYIMSNGFYKVLYNGITAWAHSNYIKITR